MFVSHRYKFVFFSDPMGACTWIERALQPWIDQPVASSRQSNAQTILFRGMSPAEAALAFDLMDLPFHQYRRIALVRNPYAKMAQLYYRISLTDPIWRARAQLGMRPVQFGRWLKQTKPNGSGAGYKTSSAWRRFGAWSATEWCKDHVTDVVPIGSATKMLSEIFNEIGIAPAFGLHPCTEISQLRLTYLYDTTSDAIIRQRYAWDIKHCGITAPFISPPKALPTAEALARNFAA